MARYGSLPRPLCIGAVFARIWPRAHAEQTYHQYEVVGRAKPDEKNKHPTVYRMKIFAPNTVVARSRFWYFLSAQKKLKRQNGEILEVHEIHERKPLVVKNFGVWLRYDSRSGTHNMYKEVRDTTLNNAIEKLYNEMSSRHRARRSAIQIIRTTTLEASQCKRVNVLQFHNSKIKFRLLHRVPRPTKAVRSTFKASAPSSFF